MIMPRCLDAYVMEAYAAAGLGDGEDPAEVDIDDEDLDEALAWAEASVCVLQQSLPWPSRTACRTANSTTVPLIAFCMPTRAC